MIDAMNLAVFWLLHFRYMDVCVYTNIFKFNRRPSDLNHGRERARTLYLLFKRSSLKGDRVNVAEQTREIDDNNSNSNSKKEHTYNNKV